MNCALRLTEPKMKSFFSGKLPTIDACSLQFGSTQCAHEHAERRRKQHNSSQPASPPKPPILQIYLFQFVINLSHSVLCKRGAFTLGDLCRQSFLILVCWVGVSFAVVWLLARIAFLSCMLRGRISPKQFEEAVQIIGAQK